MTDPFLNPYTASRLRSEADRLERLAADLRRIADGVGPTPADLEAAPTLHGWSRSEMTLPCLIGRVIGHPSIPDTHLTKTTDLWTMNPGSGWARTLSRFYRLGEPAGRPETLN